MSRRTIRTASCTASMSILPISSRRAGRRRGRRSGFACWKACRGKSMVPHGPAAGNRGSGIPATDATGRAMRRPRARGGCRGGGRLVQHRRARQHSHPVAAPRRPRDGDPQLRWIWAKNHESRGCIGCHEDGELAPDDRFAKALATHRSPFVQIPRCGGPRIFAMTCCRSVQEQMSRLPRQGPESAVFRRGLQSGR